MQPKLAALVLLLLIGAVVGRVIFMRRRGLNPVQFGKRDKKDYLIPPFALLYFYIVFAHAFNWPSFINRTLLQYDLLAWLGILLCVGGLVIFLLSVISFGTSFRVGIDHDHPDKLVTSGIFSISRNPIYIGFWLVLLGQFLVFPNLLFLLYIPAASWLFHRQVLLEEAFLSQHYGAEYNQYCSKVRRYL